MGAKHIAEELIEAGKKLSELIDKVESEESLEDNRKRVIDGVNTVIRQLDHIVEQLGHKR